MSEKPWRMPFDYNEMAVKICKNCKGLGISWDANGNAHHCPHCHGKGRVVAMKHVKEFPLDSIDYGQDRLLVDYDHEQLQMLGEEIINDLNKEEEEETHPEYLGELIPKALKEGAK